MKVPDVGCKCNRGEVEQSIAYFDIAGIEVLAVESTVCKSALKKVHLLGEGKQGKLLEATN